MNARSRQSKKRTRIQLQNEERIYEAALDVFSTFGFRGSTIDQIAEQAGMSKPNLLYYFANKQDIYVAVLERTLEIWLEPLTQLDPDGDPAEEIWNYIRRKLELSRLSPESSRMFSNEILQGAPNIKDVLEGPLKALVDQKCSVIRQWIDRGQVADVEPKHLIFMIWAATQHYADFEVQIDAITGPGANRDESYANAEKTLKTIFLNGLLPRS